MAACNFLIKILGVATEMDSGSHQQKMNLLKYIRKLTKPMRRIAFHDMKMNRTHEELGIFEHRKMFSKI
jgi:hypothetical protein